MFHHFIQDIIEALSDVIPQVRNVDPYEFHKEVRQMYNWHHVAERTEIVYDKIMETKPLPLMERLKNYNSSGVVAGKLFCLIAIFDFLIWRILEWFMPRSNIDIARDFPREIYQENKDKL